MSDWLFELIMTCAWILIPIGLSLLLISPVLFVDFHAWINEMFPVIKQ